MFVVVAGVSSLLDESEEELEEAARLLRFRFLFLCTGGFVACGGIFGRLILKSRTTQKKEEKEKRST